MCRKLDHSILNVSIHAYAFTPRQLRKTSKFVCLDKCLQTTKMWIRHNYQNPNFRVQWHARYDYGRINDSKPRVNLQSSSNEKPPSLNG
jgi:hypothetical protein